MRSCSRLIHPCVGIVLSLTAAISCYAADGPPATSDARVPYVLDRGNAVLIVGLGLGACVAKAIENPDDTARQLDRSPLDGAIDVGNVYGEGYTIGLASLGLVAMGHISGRDVYGRAGRDLASSLLGAWAVTWTLKVAVDARRPNGGRYSFPSGHTATAFAAAPVLARHFGPIVGGAAYGAAALTGLARMEEHKHFIADVLVGAAIGVVAGRTFTAEHPLRVFGVPGGGGVGLTLGF